MNDERYRRRKIESSRTIAADGTAVLRLGRPARGRYWLVDRAAFVIDGTAAGTILVRVLDGDPAAGDTGLLDTQELAVAATGIVRAIGEFGPPIWVNGSEELVVAVSGATATGRAYARFQLREVEEEPESVEDLSVVEEAREPEPAPAR